MKVDNKDLTPAQIVALLHDNKITLLSIAADCGLSNSSGMSIALRKNFPLVEQRVASALNIHPMQLWPSRYNENGRRIIEDKRKKRTFEQLIELYKKD